MGKTAQSNDIGYKPFNIGDTDYNMANMSFDKTGICIQTASIWCENCVDQQAKFLRLLDLLV